MIFGQGLNTVVLLYGAGAGSYCQGPSRKAFKGGVVSSQMQALGGNAQSLSSPCYIDPKTGNYYENQ